MRGYRTEVYMRWQSNWLCFFVFTNCQVIFTLTNAAANGTWQVKKCSEPLQHSLDWPDLFSLCLTKVTLYNPFPINSSKLQNPLLSFETVLTCLSNRDWKARLACLLTPWIQLNKCEVPDPSGSSSIRLNLDSISKN